MRVWKANNRDKVQANAKRYYDRHTDRLKDRRARFRQDNPDKIKNKHLKYKYGITLDFWNILFESQDYKCAICRSDSPLGPNWHTDHDHVDLSVRGILCGPCNLGLGAFKDNPDNLIKASKYLKIRKGT